MIKIISLILMVVGVFVYFEISPLQMIDDIINKFSNEDTTLRAKIKRNKVVKKKSYTRSIIQDARKTLVINNRGSHFPIYCLMSAAGLFIGFTVCMAINNLFLMPVLMLGLAISPFILIRFMSYSYQKQLNSELETALSIITTAYMRQPDFVSAVKENVDYIQEPLNKIFQGFVFEVENVNPDIGSALENMSEKLENQTWREWCDNISLCQANKDLRSTLEPIIGKFSDVRIVGEELSSALYAPLKELITMCLMLLATLPFMFFLSKDWFDVLFQTNPGKIALAIDAAIIFISLHAGVKHSKPVEYRR